METELRTVDFKTKDDDGPALSKQDNWYPEILHRIFIGCLYRTDPSNVQHRIQPELYP